MEQVLDYRAHVSPLRWPRIEVTGNHGVCNTRPIRKSLAWDACGLQSAELQFPENRARKSFLGGGAEKKRTNTRRAVLARFVSETCEGTKSLFVSENKYTKNRYSPRLRNEELSFPSC